MAANFRSALRAGALVATAWVSGFALADDDGAAISLPSSRAQASLAQLEDAFWFCDYVATTQGVAAAPRAACRYVTEEVKRQKFGGDFDRFLQWWRDNKAAEYARIEHAQRS
ncbi:MAG TPA: hypothetical protein VFP36_14225 [Usitatibacter sp.]|nr:hypothetical protein [Usitatibacter sp.]